MTVRRRLLRPTSVAADRVDNRRLAKARERLTRERVVLQRWMTKLRRAFRAVEKSQRRIVRWERLTGA
jgi:hypothetical protein